MKDNSNDLPAPSSPSMPPLLTIKEAADYLRLTPSALYTQRHRGEAPGVLGIRIGRRILYRSSDINRFLDQRLQETRGRRDSSTLG